MCVCEREKYTLGIWCERGFLLLISHLVEYTQKKEEGKTEDNRSWCQGLVFFIYIFYFSSRHLWRSLSVFVCEISVFVWRWVAQQLKKKKSNTTTTTHGICIKVEMCEGGGEGDRK